MSCYVLMLLIMIAASSSSPGVHWSCCSSSTCRSSKTRAADTCRRMPVMAPVSTCILVSSPASFVFYEELKHLGWCCPGPRKSAAVKHITMVMWPHAGVEGFYNATIIVEQQEPVPPVGPISSRSSSVPLAAIVVPAVVGGVLIVAVFSWLIWCYCLVAEASESEGHHHKPLQQKELLLVAHDSKSNSNSHLQLELADGQQQQQQRDSGSPPLSCRTDGEGGSPSAAVAQGSAHLHGLEQGSPRQQKRSNRKSSKSRRPSSRSQGFPPRHSPSGGLGLAEGLLRLLPGSSVWSRSSRAREGRSGREGMLNGETSDPGSSDLATQETDCRTVASHHGGSLGSALLS